MVTEQARPSLASFVVEVHRLATGRTITIAEALNYFRDPRALADTVRQSRLMDDPQQRRYLQQLLAAQQTEESGHGI